MTAHTNSAVDQSFGADEYTDLTISDFTTTHNTGTIAFNNGVEKESNVSYESSTLSEDSSYEDGQLLVTTRSLDEGGIPPTSGSVKYQVIGSDSLYYPAGGFFTVDGSGVSQTTPVGSKFTFHGDTLVIMTTIHQVTDQGYPGQPATQTIDATATAYFLR
ncbi:MAG TPA: hypothetical protein VN616_09970 [Puia sp.]|nr:hypothetical protein [Puia sp.]